MRYLIVIIAAIIVYDQEPEIIGECMVEETIEMDGVTLVWCHDEEDSHPVVLDDD